jgi:hypothetical protein
LPGQHFWWDLIIDEDRGIEPEQARMAQTSQCDLLRQPGVMQCGIYCEAAGFIARVISRCTLDSSWSSDRRGRSIDTAASYAGDGAT